VASLGCIDCEPNSFYRPERIYIFNGNTLCGHCLGLRMKAEKFDTLEKVESNG
jgi:hypothetical protein